VVAPTSYIWRCAAGRIGRSAHRALETLAGQFGSESARRSIRQHAGRDPGIVCWRRRAIDERIGRAFREVRAANAERITGRMTAWRGTA
jgi:hypothetical protein